MKQNYFLQLLAAIMLMSIVGCAATSTNESTGEYFDDSLITTKVKAAIFYDPYLKSAEINVETFKGVVQLSGFVISRNNVIRATELAQSIKGVTSVKNDMRIK